MDRSVERETAPLCDGMGHPWGAWYRLHRRGDLVTGSYRRFVYYKRCSVAVRDRLADINAQAIHDRDDALMLAQKDHPRGQRHVSGEGRVEELTVDARTIVRAAREEIDAIVAQHLATLSPEKQAANEASFDEEIERARFGAAHERVGQEHPLQVPEFLRSRRTFGRS